MAFSIVNVFPSAKSINPSSFANLMVLFCASRVTELEALEGLLEDQ